VTIKYSQNIEFHNIILLRNKDNMTSVIEPNKLFRHYLCVSVPFNMYKKFIVYYIILTYDEKGKILTFFLQRVE